MSMCSAGYCSYRLFRLGAITCSASSGLTLTRTQPLGPLILPVNSLLSSAVVSSRRLPCARKVSPSSVRLRPCVLR